MASTYSTSLKIELMATGENSGTWGTTTNTNLGTALEQAIVGMGNPDYTADADLTITLTSSNASQTARCLVLNVTSTFGSLTATRELIVPTIEKEYVVQNNTAGDQSILVKTAAGTGITVPNGFAGHFYVDGTNVVQMADFIPVIRFNSMLGNGGTFITAILDEDTLVSDSATALATQQSIKAYVDAQVTAQDLDFAGGTGTGSVDLDSQSFTIAGTANEIETSASGQTLTVGIPDAVTLGTPTFTNSPTINALTASQAVFTNGSKVLVSNAITGTGNVVMSTSPALVTPTGIVKGDVGLGNVDNTSDTTKNAATATLTNKTIDYASNTLTGVEPTLVSGTTIKTLSGQSLLGSGDIPGGGDVLLTATQTLTNKTFDNITTEGYTATALHRSPNAITSTFVYDTSKDSDGGAWTEKCQNTSWYNEALSGTWLGAWSAETQARYAGSTVGVELVDTANTAGAWVVYGTNTVVQEGTAVKISYVNSTNGALVYLRETGGTTQDMVAGVFYRLTLRIKVSAGGVVTVSYSNGAAQNVVTQAVGTTDYSTVELYVTPSNVDGYLRIQDMGAGESAWISDISVREVTAQTTTTGDYYQLTTDGKFYNLNKNLLTTTATLATQTQWLTAGTYTLSSTTASSGSVDVSGAATASHTAGTPTTFTVATSGNVVFTVTGSVTTAQCELASAATTYQANASTSRVTEVFRGNKRDFPRLAGIVAEAARVSVYDLTEPSRPMWMAFANTTDYAYSGNATSVAALNGLFNVTSSTGLFEIDFAKDQSRLRNVTNYYNYNRNIANRNTVATNYALGTAFKITNSTVNAVAMTTMPDAPIDPVTGLAVPTVAVATGAGVSVIQDDGSVSNRAATAWTKITLTPELLSVGYAGGAWYYGSSSATVNTPPLAPNKLPATFLLSYNDTTDALDFNQGNTAQLIATSRSDLIRSSGALVQTLVNNEDVVTKGVTATIAPTYNTGHLAGDIRRAYLADIGAGSVTLSSQISDPTFASGITGWSAPVEFSSVTWNGSNSLGLVNSKGGWQYARAEYVLATLIVGQPYLLRFEGLGGPLVAYGYVDIDTTRILSNIGSTGHFAASFIATSASQTLKIVYGVTALSTVVIDNVYVSGGVSDRSYKAQGAPITGTLTKTEVASAAQMVAYSGFSATDYLQESYSADLDFGTGEFSVGAWANVPVVLPDVSFPVVGSELVTNGTFDTDTTGWTEYNSPTLAIVAQQMQVTNSSFSGAYQLIPVVAGKAYRVSGTVNGFVPWLRVGTSAGAAQFGSTAQTSYAEPTTVGFVFTATSTDSLYLSAAIGNATAGQTATFDNISVVEVGPSLIADRAFSSGPSINLSITGTGTLTATAYDGTTTRTVTTTAAYNTATWVKAEAVYTTDGSLAIRVNGVEAAVTRGNPLLTMTNASAVLTIGNSYALDAPFPGSIALVKLGATVPTAEQSLWMYEQEKPMFNAGAQVCLADTGTIVDLAYDEATDKWIAASAGYRNEFDGLVRTDAVVSPAGSYSKLAAAGGVKLQARITTTPGVDITIPAYNLREELVKRSEAAAKLNANTATFDYVGGFTANTTSGNTAILSAAGLTYPTSYIGAKISGSGIPADTTIIAVSGTTLYLSAAATATATGVQISFFDFILPTGMEATTVVSAGAVKTEGSTKDYTTLFDGFKETVRFGTEPGYTAAVQITTTRSAA